MDGKKTVDGRELRNRISTLWVVVMFNMAFADILGFITPGVIKGLMTGTADGLAITQPLLLVFAALIEIPVAMIFLSRVLAPKANRAANLAASAVTVVFILGGASPYLHYYFFAAAEAVSMLAISWMAWKLPSAPVGDQGAPK